MTIYMDWSTGWLKEGQFLEYHKDGVSYYERVRARDFAHWEYAWPESIPTVSESGPYVPNDLEITRGYRESTHTNRIWQLIFGIKGQILIYLEVPTDIHRHGIPKDPKPGTSNRFTSHFEEYMSPFYQPSFLTETFMMRPDVSQIGIDAYNPDAITHQDVRLNFFINKLDTDRVGTVSLTENGVLFQPTSEKRWSETLKKLWQSQIPCRPITLLPVRSPAEAPSGE